MFCPLQCGAKIQKTGEEVVRVTEKEHIYYLTKREVINETISKKSIQYSQIF